MVCNRCGARNYHFRDLLILQIANDVRKAEEDLIFYRKCNPKSLPTVTTLARPSIKHGVLGGYIL